MLKSLFQRVKRFFVYGTAGAVIAVGATTMDDNVLQHVKDFEGKVLTAYYDIVGVPTIGYGHTNRAGTVKFNMGDTWSEEYASKVLEQDLEKFWDAVDAAVVVDLTNCQLSVLTSWTYNVGPGAMRGSTLVRLLNQGQYNAVPAQLMRWDKAGGKRLRGLTRRRAAEANLWKTNCKG